MFTGDDDIYIKKVKFIEIYWVNSDKHKQTRNILQMYSKNIKRY